MISQTLAQEVSQMEADLCSAFADPTRILILYALDEKPRNVGELATELQIPQPSVSRHLKVLRERGMVGSTRYGATIEYRIVNDRPIQALDLLRSVLRDNLTRSAELVDALNESAES